MTSGDFTGGAGGTAPEDRETTELLFEARKRGTTGLDLSSRGYDRRTALALQLVVLDRFVGAGDRLAGWKASYTSGAARDRMGLGYRPFGYILESRTLASGSRVPLRSFANVAVEPELCLVMGSTLRGAVGRDEARAAVRGIAPAFELNELRYAPHCDDATILADGCGNWGIVAGAERPADLAPVATVELWCGSVLRSTATPGDALDDSFLSLARLATLLGEFGRALAPGDRVITGSYSREVVREPSEWRAVFRGVGEVKIEFTA